MTKALLVTGGAVRVGRAILEAAHATGWRPVVHYNSSSDEAEALADKLGGVAIGLELGPDGSGERLIELASEAVGGPIAGLVNSASIFPHDLASDVTEEDLLKSFRVNAVAPMMASKAFAAQSPDGGVIVNILDTKLFNLYPDHFSYTISKQALHGATLMMARSFAPKVRVVGVAPGYNLPSPGQPEEVFERLAPTVNALQRRLHPDDVADAVVFALNNRSVTAQVIIADNGEHLIQRTRDVLFEE